MSINRFTNSVPIPRRRQSDATAKVEMYPFDAPSVRARPKPTTRPPSRATTVRVAPRIIWANRLWSSTRVCQPTSISNWRTCSKSSEQIERYVTFIGLAIDRFVLYVECIFLTNFLSFIERSVFSFVPVAASDLGARMNWAGNRYRMIDFLSNVVPFRLKSQQHAKDGK